MNIVLLVHFLSIVLNTYLLNSQGSNYFHMKHNITFVFKMWI